MWRQPAFCFALYFLTATTAVIGQSCPPVEDSAAVLAINCSLGATAVDCRQPMAVGSRNRVLLANRTTTTLTCNLSTAWTAQDSSHLPECGRRSGSTRQILVLNETVDVGDLPWHVAVYSSSPRMSLLRDNTFDFKCGGTLITATFVVTGAQCVRYRSTNVTTHDASRFRLAARKFDRDYDAVEPEAQTRRVKAIFTMDEFDASWSSNLARDFALVEAEAEFVLTWAVNVACVDWSDRFQMTAQDLAVTAVWRRDEGDTSRRLLATERRHVVSLSSCRSSTDPEQLLYLTDDKMCTATNDTDSCETMTGAGLVSARDGRFHLRGVNSVWLKTKRPTEGCLVDSLAGYTDVAPYIAWIRQHVFSQ